MPETYPPTHGAYSDIRKIFGQEYDFCHMGSEQIESLAHESGYGWLMIDAEAKKVVEEAEKILSEESIKEEQ